MQYAWLITKDHLASDDRDEAGVSGPSDAPDDMLSRLKEGKGHTFRMYDDDGKLYYTGRAILPPDDAVGDWETPLAGPLRDFGGPNAGCTEIKWHGHPEWTCEY